MSHSPDPSTDKSIVVLIPTYNDWEALELVVGALDRHVSLLNWQVSILIVDDGSDRTDLPESLSSPRQSIAKLDVLTLRHNLGHQRAIAIGLAWLEANMPCTAVVIMDGDGEDAPSDVPRLIAQFEETGATKMIFASRHRRSEGLTFQTFYHLYRLIHRVLTGLPVRIGNFSLLPWPLLRKLVVLSDLWSHYGAAALKSRLPMTTIPTRRATRLGGRPTMNFTDLVMHGLSAMSVLGDRISVRLLAAASSLLLVSLIILAGFVGSGILETIESQKATITTIMLSIFFAAQLVLVATLLALGALGRRNVATFLPLRDYGYFVDRHITLWQRNQ